MDIGSIIGYSHMSNSILYYRTTGTTTTAIDSLPSNQTVLFDSSAVRLEKITRPYKNNITDTPVVTSDGTRSINIQDNGILSNTYQLLCSFRMDKSEATTAYANLESLITRGQVESKFPYGNVGLFVPNMSLPFTIDPNATASTNATRGLSVKDVDYVWDVREFKTLYVTILLKFGGTK